jgi:hypothetical protein
MYPARSLSRSNSRNVAKSGRRVARLLVGLGIAFFFLPKQR